MRRTEGLRRLARETHLAPQDLVLPVFVTGGKGVRQPIASMPGVERLSIDLLVEEARTARSLGLGGLLLFGIPDTKDAVGSSGTDPDGIVPRALRALKDAVPELPLIADICLCEYTDHGHCGVIGEVLPRGDRAQRTAVPAAETRGAEPGADRREPPSFEVLPRGDRAQRTAVPAAETRGAEPGADRREPPSFEVLNDESLPLLAKMAVSCAKAGADVVAPSDMMDGRVDALRTALDDAKLAHTPILAYSAKYASGFYGPFREAAGSTPSFGDRRGYQMDPANVREALREVELDLDEGADMVMVKPALSYLDVIAKVREITDVPLCAFNVSAEYSMVKAAAHNGWIDERRVTLEILLSIRRAGADFILTYHAKDAAKWLA